MKKFEKLIEFLTAVCMQFTLSQVYEIGTIIFRHRCVQLVKGLVTRRHWLEIYHFASGSTGMCNADRQRALRGI